MSVKIMARAWEVRLADSEKLVLLALADWSDDDGNCWPSVPQLAKKCSKGERTIQHAIKALEDAGHLERKVIVGRGTRYKVHPRNDCTPAAAAPRRNDAPAEIAPTPAAAAPNTLAKHQDTSEAKASSVARKAGDAVSALVEKTKRGTALPSNFEPILTPDAQSTVDGWPPGMFTTELAQWRDYHAAKGTIAKDWQASLRTWLRNAERFRKQQNGRLPQRADSMGRPGADASGASLLAELAQRREARAQR